MKVNTIICPSCHEQIYSRAHHDMRFCSCGEVAIDGGQQYVRLAFKTTSPDIIEVEIEATPKELYDDWNKSIDKLGKIKSSQRPAKNRKKS